MNTIQTRRHNQRLKKRQRNTLAFLIVGGMLLITAGIMIAKSALSHKADPSLIEISGQPSLQVDQELIDYGDVKLDTNLTFALKLTNVGDQALKISDTPYVEVKEGC